MSLVINIVKSSISEDGTTMYLSDNTGAYEPSDNPTGYGPPNPARADLAVFILATNKRIDEGDVDLEVADYNPASATSWSVTLHKDGWQQVNSYGLRRYDVNTSFSVTELTYDVASEEIRKIATKSGTGPYTYTYTVVTEAALVDEANIILYESTLNTLVTEVSLNQCHYKANKKFFNEVDVDNSTIVFDDVNFNRYMKLDAYLKAITYDFANGNYTNAEAMVEQAEKICDCFTEDCDC